ncbi:MAG: translation elongation factor Ts [Planctomycetota bacterium]|nr:MAG: translation elongation factor Ts [Planctomycetota bacterium]
MSISPKDVMNLRNRTGLPMMACKKALAEANGDVDAAEELLRKQLKGKMDKRVDRAAGEGRIGIAIGDGAAAIIELRAETDFTAKNEKFVDATNKLAALAMQAEGQGDIAPSDAMAAIIDELRISTGENISLGRARKLSGPGTFGQYVHHDGKTGVLIHAEGPVSDETLRQIGMHITAAVPRPLGISPDDIPADVVEKERNFRVQQAMESGKPKEIAEKIVEGGMRKFFSEVALLEQAFVMDPAKKISDILGEATVKAFIRWEVGETA